MFKVYKKLFSYVPEYKFMAYLTILLAALLSILSIGAFYFVYQFLNQLIAQNSATDSAFYAMTIMVMMVASILIYMFAGGLAHLIAFRLEMNLRKKGIDALTTSNFSYFDTTTSGKIRKTTDGNAAGTHTIITHLTPDNTTSFVTIAVLLGITFAISAYMGIALLVLATVVVSQIKSIMGDAELVKSYMQSLENMDSETVEYVRGTQMIKIFKTSVQSFKTFYQAIKDYSDYALNYSSPCRQAYVISQVTFAAYTVLSILIYTALMPQSQYLESVPQFIFFFCAAGLMYLTSMKIMYVFMYLYKGDISAEKIETICEEMTSNRVSTGQEEASADGSIRFENVSLGYEEQNIVEDLSFTLDENKAYAFVGSSGSGKSTITKLIAGFYKINNGSILLGGKPIENYRQKALMKHVAFVFQQPKLFKMSVFDNVKLGNPKASYEQVMGALRLISCQEILDKSPERENTVIDSKGVHLSGGGQQRIAIARTTLRDAKIVILDEAPAATDVNNEYQIQKAFASLITDETITIIAHRLSSIKGIDEIFVINKGAIVERGSDQELTAAVGRYKHFKELYASVNEWRVS